MTTLKPLVLRQSGDRERAASTAAVRSYVIPLSAKTEQALSRKAQDLLHWLEREGNLYPFAHVAFTLMAGRSHFSRRMACLAGDAQELMLQLRSLASGITAGWNQGSVLSKRELADPSAILRGEGIIQELCNPQSTEDAVRHVRLLNELAALYVDGYSLPFAQLYEGPAYRRVPLPGYPFERERYWLPEPVYPLNHTAGSGETMPKPRQPSHPMIDSDESGLQGPVYRKVWNGAEFYLRDHRFGADKVLPGVAYLEIARAAAEAAYPSMQVIRIEDVVWSLPLRMSEGEQTASVLIRLQPSADRPSAALFTIEEEEEGGRPGAGSSPRVHSRGTVILGSHADNPAHPLQRLEADPIRKRCVIEMDGEECYRRFQGRGLQLGETFRTIQKLACSETEGLAELELPVVLQQSASDFKLHPALLDGALQTVIGLVESAGLGQLSLPCGIDSVTLYRPLQHRCLAYARAAAGRPQQPGFRAFDISIASLEGEILAELCGFLLQDPGQLHAAAPAQVPAQRPAVPFSAASAGKTAASGSAIALYRKEWQEAPRGEELRRTGGTLLLFDQGTGDISPLQWPYDSVIRIRPGSGFRELGPDLYEINPVSSEDCTALLNGLQSAGLEPDAVLHAWCLTPPSSLEERLKLGFYSLLALCRSLAGQTGGKPLRLVHLYAADRPEAYPELAAIGSFFMAVGKERQRLRGTSLLWCGPLPSAGIQAALPELTGEADAEVMMLNGQRFVHQLIQEGDAVKKAQGAAFRPGGTYLISGGMGGIGRIIARHLARNYGARLVLFGRTPENAGIRAEQELLRSLGGEAFYVQGDVSVPADVRSVVEQAKARYGMLQGVLHAAGMNLDRYLPDKTMAEARDVLAPKISGALLLDEYTAQEPLELFCLFSSIAAAAGNAAQTDYAFANGYLDAYARLREQRRAAGEANGVTVSVNWPLWQEGGMQVDEQTALLFEQSMGAVPLTAEEGCTLLEQALQLGEPQIAVLKGDLSKLATSISISPKKQEAARPSAAAPPRDIFPVLYDELRSIVAGLLKLKPEAVHPAKEFSEYGFHSLSLTDFVNRVNARFGLSMTPAVFFEYSSLGAFGEHVLAEGGEALAARLLPLPQSPAPALPVQDLPVPEQPSVPEQSPVPKRTPLIMHVPEEDEAGRSQATEEHAGGPENEAIAIVGMSGIFPGSENLEEFWSNLEAERDLVTEIPQDRWNYKDFYDESNQAANRSSAKWGGFMKEVDKFDAAFFGISPREAGLMDPQQRIFLETVYRTIGDAGYKPADFSGTKTGMFVGVSSMDYYDCLRDNKVAIEPNIATGVSFSILVNRISYLLNLHGPSEPVDTACSSSLIAIHRAVQAIRNGDCEAAIAGGVNVLLSPMLFVAFGKAGMLSPSGRCRTFDKGADGYVRGEGAGAILLKPLSKAVADGDHIHGIIRGTAVNHGGHANSLTAPNPNAQAELLVQAYKRAGIDPDTVSYIEAHGTGTALGDPVEINGLKKAFAQLKDSPVRPAAAHCGLGSVKTNIGHLESAAGIAGVLKILLSMRHGKLPATLHYRERNPYIELEGSPFYIVDKTVPWTAPPDISGLPVPRRAGVSSFGFGGANAHIVLEQYPQTLLKEGKASPGSPRPGEHLFLFSARTEERLQAVVSDMLGHLARRPAAGAALDGYGNGADLEPLLLRWAGEISGAGPGSIEASDSFEECGLTDPVRLSAYAARIREELQTELNVRVFSEYPNIRELSAYLSRVAVLPGNLPEEEYWADAAYTLQLGREAFERRLAVVAADGKELSERLTAYLHGSMDRKKLYTGIVKPDEHQRLASAALDDPQRLAMEWCEGAKVDWPALYRGQHRKRTPLPVYPFARKRYWFDAFVKPQATAALPRQEAGAKANVPDNAVPNEALPPVAPYSGNKVSLDILEDHIALITLKDREQSNMFSEELVQGLIARFDEVRRNARVKAVIVTGYDHVFCMGGTQEQLVGIADQKSKFSDIPFLYRGLLETEVPVIAAIQGHASGGGLLFGLYADIVVMAEESIYTASFTKYGFTPGMGATFILKDKFGSNLAAEMMYTAKTFKGSELQERGAAVLFRKRDQVLAEALGIARTLAEKTAYTLKVLKSELASRILQQLPPIIDRENEMHTLTFAHPDVRRNIARYFQPEPELQQPEPVSERSHTTVLEEERILNKLLEGLKNGQLTPEEALAWTAQQNQTEPEKGRIMHVERV